MAQINARVLEILYLQQALRTSVVDGIEPDVDSIQQALAYLNHNNDDQLALLSVIAGAVTNRPGGSADGRDGNPWWYTNSTFYARNTWTRTGLQSGPSTAVPSDPAAVRFTFPELVSFWSAQLASENRTGTGMNNYRLQTMAEGEALWSNGGWSNMWGVGRMPGSQQIANIQYTWFDWMADVEKRKLALAGLAGTTDAPSAVDTAATDAVDDGSTDGTNGVPEMVIEQMDVSGVEAALELVDAQAVGDMLPASFSGASPEIVVFSGGRYGDVDVPEVRASLAIPEDVARYMRGVLTWLWRVALFVGCFVIVRQEVAFWSTLGGSTSDA